MGQQEGFRTPGGVRGAAADAPAPPLFDERSARRAAPVVPLEKIARRQRLARWAGNWRETVRSPQFRRSWPLALLVVATLAAAVAAMGIYNQDNNAPAAATTTTNATAGATADAGTTATSPAPDEIKNSREASDARRGREDGVAPDAAALGSGEAFAAPTALGSFLGGEADEQQDEAAPGRDERGAERDKGKRQKRSKRRQQPRRSGGGAILFDVIR